MFQKNVTTKYLQTQNENLLQQKWLDYTNHFQNAAIQENIRNAKEEQYQEGFLRDLFVKILGYTLNPDKDFNLTTELKNIKDSKKADGAIIINEEIKAVIELKGTNTTDLGKIETQAFGYKNNQNDCTYVITSNFEKLRFYIDNAIEFIEFNLFALTKNEFDLLYLCLAFDNIKNDLAKKIKDESVSQEDVITKKLYKDYSFFKQELFKDLIKNNPDFEQIELFKKSQKLLDRFLFLFFGEDRHLLPPNSMRKIIDDWIKLKDLDAYFPLYERIQKYFEYLNAGNKDLGIYAYNGGLFKSDEILDNVKISDEILYHHTKKLSEYDFASEVDVNILGHIFENSLNEIDEIKAQIEGQEVDKSKTKRKKDGVFYTPKYITKYIVENTVGKLCDDKKSEFDIFQKDEISVSTKKQKEKSYNELQQYKNWLLQITICDPACGSGAFLNEALDFLIKEHNYIAELEAKITGSSLVLTDIENSILENNLYGVDINEESVQIAKLSLWLRTAQPNRKLNDLSNNIKCGNSLIDDPEIAGDKAFDWEKEFSQVFENGGFDVVIGNPPYVNAIEVKKSSTPNEFKFLKENFETAKGTVDLYIYFFEKGIQILRKDGLLSYITPNRFLSVSYGVALREFILNNCKLYTLVDYSDKRVFSDASTYPVITFLEKTKEIDYNVITGKFDDETKQFIGNYFPSSRLGIIENNILGFLLNDKLPITEKVINQSENLNIVGKINATSTAKEADDYSKLINENSGLKLINTGTIDPFMTTWGFSELTDKGQKFIKPFLPLNNSVISENRYNLYKSQKIIISKIGLQCEAFYDKNGEYASVNTNCIHSFSENFHPEYVLCWLNSKLYNYLFECLFDGLRMSGGYLLFSAPNLKNTYIKEIPLSEQQPFIAKADLMLQLNQELQNSSERFLKLLSSELNLSEPSKKLQEWYNLDFSEFSKELSKKKITLSLSQKSEWMDFFETEQQKAQNIKIQIQKTDNEIDQMVYELYGLSEEEVLLVEN